MKYSMQRLKHFKNNAKWCILKAEESFDLVSDEMAKTWEAIKTTQNHEHKISNNSGQNSPEVTKISQETGYGLEKSSQYKIESTSERIRTFGY